MDCTPQQNAACPAAPSPQISSNAEPCLDETRTVFGDTSGRDYGDALVPCQVRLRKVYQTRDNNNMCVNTVSLIQIYIYICVCVPSEQM